MTTDNNGFNHTDENEHKEICSAMVGFMDSGNPQLGIFWYDTKAQSLFGIEKTDADKAIFVNGKVRVKRKVEQERLRGLVAVKKLRAVLQDQVAHGCKFFYDFFFARKPDKAWNRVGNLDKSDRLRSRLGREFLAGDFYSRDLL